MEMNGTGTSLGGGHVNGDSKSTLNHAIIFTQVSSVCVAKKLFLIVCIDANVCCLFEWCASVSCLCVCVFG